VVGGASSGFKNDPTGQVFNAGGSATLRFAIIDGSIEAWNAGAGTPAKVEATTEGAGGTNVDPDALYFTAGLAGQTNGLCGEIDFPNPVATPEPATILETASAMVLIALFSIRRHHLS
jgi:hypothetical protein